MLVRQFGRIAMRALALLLLGWSACVAFDAIEIAVSSACTFSSTARASFSVLLLRNARAGAGAGRG